jgi:transposase
VKPRDVVAFAAQLPPCVIGMEACATAHHWTRELGRLGHEVKLILPAYVKAMCAGRRTTRPAMRFVLVKSAEQQGVLMLRRARELLVGQRTALINALRSHLAEFGVVAPQGARQSSSPWSRTPVTPACRHRARGARAAGAADATARGGDRPSRPAALGVASRGRDEPPAGDDPRHRAGLGHRGQRHRPVMFNSGREFAAFLGLVRRQSSSGGKERLGRISKMGDRYIRTLLVVGATAVLRYAKKGGSSSKAWAEALLQRKPFKVAAVALANETARIAWAVLTRGETYQAARPMRWR